MNGSIRQVRGERIYPISAMGANTADGIVDVEAFCRDNNMTPVALMVTGSVDDEGDMWPFVGVDITPGGQDNHHHYVMPFFTGWIYDISVKRIHTETVAASGYHSAAEVFILGINP